MNNLHVTVTDRNEDVHTFVRIAHLSIVDDNYLTITALDGSYYAFSHDTVKAFSVEDYKEGE